METKNSVYQALAMLMNMGTVTFNLGIIKKNILFPGTEHRICFFIITNYYLQKLSCTHAIIRFVLTQIILKKALIMTMYKIESKKIVLLLVKIMADMLKVNIANNNIYTWFFNL